MKQLTQFIEKHGSGKKVLLFFILANIVFLFMLMVTIPQTMGCLKGMKLLDVTPMGYDLNYVNELFSALGEEGRKSYLNSQIPMDMIYPFLFGLSNLLLLAYFLKKLNKHSLPYTYLCLLPIVAGTADYAENFGILYLLKSYPNLTETAVTTTSTFTIIKSISTSLFYVVLIITLVLVGIKTLNRKRLP